MSTRQKFMSRIASVAMALSMVVLSQAAALAQSTLVCDRGLPTQYLNNAAGANRSNVAWTFGPDWITGDDCTIGAPGELYVITKVRGWNTQGAPNGLEMGDRFKSISLYLGRPGEALTPVATGALTLSSSTNSNPSITHTRVTYSNGANYQGSSGAFIQIWQNDFSDLAFVVSGGEKLYFSGDGILQDGVPYYWFNHASNAALSGSTQQDADDFFLGWDRADLGTAWPWNSSCASGYPDCGGWDKSSDINVQVFASLVATSTTSKDQCKNGGWKTLVRTNLTSFKN